MNIFSIVIDVFLLAILILCVISGYKKGLIKMLFSLAAIIVSGVLAGAFSPHIAQWLSDNIIRESVVSLLTQELEGVVQTDIQSLLAAVPEFVIKAAEVAEISIENLLEACPEPSELAENIYASINESFIIPAVRVIVFIVIFIVLSVILSVAVTFINRLLKKSSLKKPNAVLGAVTGGLKGISYVCIISIILEGLSFIFTETELSQTVEATYIQQFIMNLIITLKEAIL